MAINKQQAPVYADVTSSKNKFSSSWLQYFEYLSNVINQLDTSINNLDTTMIGLLTLLILPAPSNPSYSANWGNYGGVWEHVTYYKELVSSRVYLQGLCKRTGATGAGETIFTLPAGYRPSADILFTQTATGAICRVEVHNDGVVVMGAGDASTYLSLSGISFRV